MSTQIDVLNKVCLSINDCLESCLSSKSIPALLQSLFDARTRLDTALSGKQPKLKALSHSRKRLTYLANCLKGMADGLEAREFSLREFRTVVLLTQKNFLAPALDSLAQASSRLHESDELRVEDVFPSSGDFSSSVKRKVAEASDFKEALQAIRSSLPKSASKPLTDKDDENLVLKESERTAALDSRIDTNTRNRISSALDKVVALRGKVPQRLKGDYEVVKLPVVPIFEAVNRQDKKGATPQVIRNFSGSRALEGLGIPHIMLQDYVILETQLLLAVQVNQILSKTTKAAGSTQRAVLEYVKELLSVINERTPTKYVLVSDKPLVNNRNKDINFFWLMPSKVLSTLLRRGWPPLKTWGFPW